jgi:UDP:flavonoid glycosyltransferase YjiC (YdhE family)
VPTVAIPQAVDQFANAAMLEAIGAGVQLAPERLHAEGLLQAVAAATARTERARELREEVRRSGGPAAAADAVEEFVESEPDLRAKSS